MLFGTFTFSMIVMAFLISTMISSVKMAYTASYGFVLTCLVLQTFLMSPLLIMLLHMNTLPDWVVFIRNIFSYYFPFNFCLIYNGISMIASSHPDNDQMRWVEGMPYTWTDFTTPRTGYVAGSEFYIPSGLDIYFTMIGNICFYAIFIWYCDHVLPSNRGRSE
jgi:hypothetical protein